MMLAWTVRQPWAWLIANGHKPLENKSTRPGRLLGQRCAVHVSRWWNRKKVRAQLELFLPGVEHLVDADIEAILDEMDKQRGRVIATVKIVGWARRVGPDEIEWGTNGALGGLWGPWLSSLVTSRWFTGPFCWGLRVVVKLPKPISKLEVVVDDLVFNSYLAGRPIRGALQSWKLPSCVEADVRNAEAPLLDAYTQELIRDLNGEGA